MQIQRAKDKRESRASALTSNYFKTNQRSFHYEQQTTSHSPACLITVACACVRVNLNKQKQRVQAAGSTAEVYACVAQVMTQCSSTFNLKISDIRKRW